MDIRFTICLLLGLAAPFAQAADLSLDLENVTEAGGQLRVAVVDSAAGWNHQTPPVAAQTAKAQGATAHFVFTGLAPGDYAVQVFHDANDNGQLDTNVAGMPLEAYGFSNNPKVMRRPTFEEAHMHVPAEGGRIVITLR